MVYEVKLPNKSSGHTLWVKGKEIKFKNGVAKVDKATAEDIKAMNSDTYTVKEQRTRRKATAKKE
jgi:hypothetical protein